jgi:Asp/Glu/hydantoin racemase
VKVRIALIHAVRVAMDPIATAFRLGWPEAETVNLLDDGLSRDLERRGTLEGPMTERIGALAAYASGLGADGILYTCSAFGTAIERARAGSRIPVLKPNEAMLEAALAAGRRIGLVATFAPTIPSMTGELEALARACGVAVAITPLLVPGAMHALDAGDGATHDRLIADAVAPLAGHDAVLLAQFSMARAAPAVAAAIGGTVLTSPETAVAKLRGLVEGRTP